MLVLYGVQSLDVHVLIAQLVGAVQAQAQQIEAQAAQNVELVGAVRAQAQQAEAQAAQNLELAKQNARQADQIEAQAERLGHHDALFAELAQTAQRAE